MDFHAKDVVHFSFTYNEVNDTDTLNQSGCNRTTCIENLYKSTNKNNG